MAPFDEVASWTAADGARLALRHREAEGPRRASLILVHGHGEHSGRYSHVAAWMAGRGIETWALDQRGSGRSPGRRGHVSRFAQYLSDIVSLRRLVQTQASGALLLLGHSLGGLIVLRYLETAPEGVRGAILSSPYVGLAMPVPRWKLTLVKLLADLAPGVPIPTGIDLASLCTDPLVVEAAAADPYCHRVITPRAWTETVAARAALVSEKDRIAVPLFFGLAGEDLIVSTPAAQRFAAGLAGDVTVKVYGGFYHEILNETRRDLVFTDLAPWLDRVLGG